MGVVSTVCFIIMYWKFFEIRMKSSKVHADQGTVSADIGFVPASGFSKLIARCPTCGRRPEKGAYVKVKGRFTSGARFTGPRAVGTVAISHPLISPSPPYGGSLVFCARG